MKIRKGTEVRIRRTNEIGTIKEVELIRKNGIVNKYCHVVTNNGKQDLWLDSSELTDIIETCVVRFANSDGQFLTLTVAQNHKVQDLRVNIGEGIPQNFSELTDIIETCVVRFANSDGQFLTLTVAQNHKVQDLRVNIGEGIPQNLKEHAGLHIYLLNQIIAKMTREYRDIELNGD